MVYPSGISIMIFVFSTLNELFLICTGLRGNYFLFRIIKQMFPFSFAVSSG